MNSHPNPKPSIEIKIVPDKKVWENFVLNYSPNTFLHSWNWGQFSIAQNEKPFYLGIYEREKLVGVALFTKVVAKRGSYLTCHGGPMLDWQKPEVFTFLRNYLRELAQKEKVHFIRIRPPLFHSEAKLGYFRNLGFIKAPMYFQAEHTLQLDLAPKSEEALLQDMRKNTRYGIRKAHREKVYVEAFLDPKGLERALNQFWPLYEQTIARQHFVPYPKDYFVNEVKILAQDNQIGIFLGKLGQEVLSAVVIIFYGDTAYYHHGASDTKYPQLYASHLTLWEAIKEAKKRELQLFDFWGIAPTDDPKHPRAGLTLFKCGFGGKRVRWMHTMDLPISWRYWLTYGYVKLERLKRGL